MQNLNLNLYNGHMQDSPKYAVGVDVGTTAVRAVVGQVEYNNNTPIIKIVGVSKVSNSGLRKGVVVNMSGPSSAIDEALGEVERISGHQVDDATISINGAHILTTKTDGMIAAGDGDQGVSVEDVERLKDVATIGKVPANREILAVIPHSYKLDGQDGIKDPISMTGTRLEINAHVLSALTPYIESLSKASEDGKLTPTNIIVSGVAAAEAVLNESQKENGVAVIDIGGSTTNVVVYEDGDLQYVGVIPIGGINITNDLAIGLKTDPEVAEKIKLEHASALRRKENSGISVKDGEEILTFQANEIDDIVEARLDELFEYIQGELKKAGRAGRLPSGVVLTGGSAELKGLVDYAKNSLGLSARIGVLPDYSGVGEEYNTPEYASAFGLMLIDSQSTSAKGGHHRSNAQSSSKKPGLVKKFIKKFRG